MTDGLNLYSYVVNNPIRLIDPNGLQSADVESTWDLLAAFTGGGTTIAIKNEILRNLPNSPKSVEGEDSASHLRVSNMSFEDAALQGQGLGVAFWGLNKIRNEERGLFDDPSVIAAQLLADFAIKSVEAPLLSAHEAGEEYAKGVIAAKKGDIYSAYGHTKNAETYFDLAFAQAFLLTNPIARLGPKSAATTTAEKIGGFNAGDGRRGGGGPISQEMYHYTDIDPRGPNSTMLTQGMYRGSSYTTEGNLSPSQAATTLGIPKPRFVLEFNPDSGFRYVGPVQSVPSREFIGGGQDWVHPGRPIPTNVQPLP